MLTPLNNLVKRYAQRLTSGPHAALFAVEKEWGGVAQKHHIDSNNVVPAKITNHTLALSCSSSEEAAAVRMKKKQIIQDLNKKTGANITDITFA